MGSNLEDMDMMAYRVGPEALQMTVQEFLEVLGIDLPELLEALPEPSLERLEGYIEEL